jgi:[ribosomal protein S5]-alanine N-acetyltransferase
MLQVDGPTLSLRYATGEDVEALFGLASDPAVTEWFSWGPYTDRAQPAAYVASLEAKRESGELLEFLTVHREHGPIGVTGLTELSVRDHRATVGTWFGRDWWGTGANRESKALVAALAFEHLGINRLTAWANVHNGRSGRALTKVGFRHEGTLRAWHVHASGVHDVDVFALLRDEWLRSDLREIPVTVTGTAPDVWNLGPV